LKCSKSTKEEKKPKKKITENRTSGQNTEKKGEKADESMAKMCRNS